MLEALKWIGGGAGEAVVTCMCSGTSHCPHMMALLHTPSLVAARRKFIVSAQHIPGVNNGIEDSLSLPHAEFWHLVRWPIRTILASRASAARRWLWWASSRAECSSVYTVEQQSKHLRSHNAH